MNTPKRPILKFVAVAGTCLELGCGAGPSGQATPPTLTFATDGASVVENAAEPNPALSGGVVLVDAGRSRLLSPGDTSTVADPIALEYAHGALWVLDAATSRVLRWDPASWAITGSLGGRGGGPGEFAQPVGITGTSRGIAVWDIGQSTVKYFHPDGATAGALHLPGMYPRTVVLEDGHVLAWELAGDRRAPDLFDPAGGKRTVEFTGRSDSPEAPEDAASKCYFTDRIAGLVLVGGCEVPRLSIHSTDGTRLAEWSVAREPRRSSPAELNQLRNAYFRTMVRSGLPESVATRAAKSSAAAYAIQRVFQRAVAVPSLALLLLLEQEPAELEPDAARLLVFSGQGVHLANLALPLAVVDLAASGDTLYVLGRARPSDPPELHVFRVERSNPGDPAARLSGARAVLDAD